MELYSYLQVENDVKFNNADIFEVHDPSKWLWAKINDCWHPIFEDED